MIELQLPAEAVDASAPLKLNLRVSTSNARSVLRFVVAAPGLALFQAWQDAQASTDTAAAPQPYLDQTWAVPTGATVDTVYTVDLAWARTDVADPVSLYVRNSGVGSFFETARMQLNYLAVVPPTPPAVLTVEVRETRIAFN